MTGSHARSTAPVFVVGSPRSGTTLLYHLLLSAGGFAVYRAQASVFNLLEPRFGDLSVARRRSSMLDAWLPSEFFRRSGLDGGRFRAKVQAHCRNAGDVLCLLMDSIAEQQRVARWAECTPENLLYVGAIKRTIPSAIFLHIVRDGRDVACSLSQQGWIGRRLRRQDDRVLYSGLYWDWMLRRGRHGLRACASDVMEVRFEELVANPTDVLAKVSGFVEHNLDYDHIREHGIGTVVEPNTSFPGQQPARDFIPVGRWRWSMGAEALAELEGATGALLEELGYALQSDEQTRRGVLRRARTKRRIAHSYFGGRYWLKTYTPLGRAFTNATLLHDFRAFDRDRLMPETGR